ncbi:MAG: RNA polymerase sigma factor RpoH [Gammaproteobacteria bacterium]|nr:RNA polymerase sigma factor RpoH [Gammaproteobacteria bacterium]
MNTALTGSIPSPIGNLSGYLAAVNRMPMLSFEEEQELARRFREEQDLNAAWSLVTSHLRFVVSLSRRYAGYGLPQEDLIQEGNIGLMKAVKRFDPSLGVRFVSFAVHWIRSEIHEFILRNWRIVKVATTKAQRKLFFNLRSAKQRLAWMDQDEAQALAEDLGVDADEVLEMEQRLYTHDRAFDAPVDAGADAPPAPVAYLEDSRFQPDAFVAEAEWESHARARMAEALEDLDERSRHIIERRWLDEDKATLQELADHYGVSAERIRQIENAAIEAMRRAVAD